jgi:hypothetical protein
VIQDFLGARRFPLCNRSFGDKERLYFDRSGPTEKECVVDRVSSQDVQLAFMTIGKFIENVYSSGELEDCIAKSFQSLIAIIDTSGWNGESF